MIVSGHSLTQETTMNLGIVTPKSGTGKEVFYKIVITNTSCESFPDFKQRMISLDGLSHAVLTSSPVSGEENCPVL